tara:strand:+ start:283 stop:531 length:249 start_codon:yes stop_codon:yes gene_type:complete
MQKSFQDMATRADNAIIQWRDMLADEGFSKSDADAILCLYLEMKLVKLDWGVGRYNVKHGAFLSIDALHNALQMTKDRAEVQ